jgi:DnaD/phage-associated family protein
MAKFRAIYHQIWADEDFQLYTPEAKLIFIYLCTNNATSESGIYHVTKKTISNDTNIPIETVSQVLSNGLKNVSYDLDNSCVYVKRFRKYNAGGQPNLIRLSIISDVKLLHMSKLWDEFIKDYPIYTDDVTNTLKLFDNCLPTVASKVSEGNSTKVTLTAKVNTKVVETDNSKKTNNNEEVVFTVYQNNFGLIQSPYIADELKVISQDYPQGWFEDAVKEAFLSAKGGKPNLNYIKSILERWLREGKDNGKKPATNLNNTTGYKINPNQYSDVRDYGKYSTPPAP